MELPFVHLRTELQMACHSPSGYYRPLLPRIRYLSQFDPALASFGAGDICKWRMSHS